MMDTMMMMEILKLEDVNFVIGNMRIVNVEKEHNNKAGGGEGRDIIRMENRNTFVWSAGELFHSKSCPLALN